MSGTSCESKPRRKHRRVRQGPANVGLYGRPPGKETWLKPSAVEIRELRARTGMSQAEFAGTLGFNRVQLSAWENGEHTPRKAPFHLMRRFVRDWERDREKQQFAEDMANPGNGRYWIPMEALAEDSQPGIVPLPPMPLPEPAIMAKETAPEPMRTRKARDPDELTPEDLLGDFD